MLVTLNKTMSIHCTLVFCSVKLILGSPLAFIRNPSLVHDIGGVGFPVALQVNSRSPPSVITVLNG